VARLARVAELALADMGLSLPQYRVLSMLGDGSAAATALADHLAVSRPNVTAIVDGLVERALVERRTDPVDRRRVRHALTTEGRRALAAADESVDARLRAIADQLPPSKARRAVAGLGLWIAALDAARRARVAAR
jgi:DNA-binding MarR family transcriptional regulator